MLAGARLLVGCALFAMCFSMAAAGFLERSVQLQTPMLPYCFTTKFNNIHAVQLFAYDSNLGEPYFGVHDEVGRLGRIGQLKYACDLAVIGDYQNGILYTSQQPCDCANDGVTVCTYKLRLLSGGVTTDIEIAEGQWAQPIRSLLGPVAGNFVFAASSVNAIYIVPNQGCLPFINAAAVAGKWAVVYRGSCAFQDKVDNAAAAGAIGVVIINSAGSSLSSPTLQNANFPVVMISNADGLKLVAAGTTATLSVGPNVGAAGPVGAAQFPPGLLYTPYSGLQDDAEYTRSTTAIRYITGNYALDPRNYLWATGVNGAKTVQVYDLSNGPDNAVLLSSLPFVNFRDVANMQFVRPAQNPSKLYMLGTDFFSDRIVVYDATNVNQVTLVDSLPLVNSQFLTLSPDNKYIYADTIDNFSSVPSVQIFSLASDGVLNNVGSISRTDVSSAGAGITGISASGLSLYVGWSQFGITAYDITRPDRPVYVALFNTFVGTSALPYTVGVQSVCAVPGLQDIVYLGNIDSAGRYTFQGLHLTRSAEQFLATSSADQLVTVRTLISGGETQINVADQSFVEGEVNTTLAVSSAKSSSNQVTIDLSQVLSALESPVLVASRSSAVAAPPPRRAHFHYQNQTLPSNVLIINVPVPILVNSAATLGASVVLMVLACAVLLL